MRITVGGCGPANCDLSWPATGCFPHISCVCLSTCASTSPRLANYRTSTTVQQKEIRSSLRRRRFSFPKMQDSSIIIWDDPPSSPFMAETDATRQINIQRDAEIDAIFDDPQATPMTHKTDVMMSSSAIGGDKENLQPGTEQETPLKRAMDRQEPATAPRPTTGRGQMLPPSTAKRAASPAAATTGKKHQYAQAQRVEEQTPSRPRLGRANTSGSNSGRAELVAIDETGIDDTCFSTFSAVPDMTLFAKLGQSSPVESDILHSDAETPRPNSRKRSSPSRSPSPTPRRQRAGTANSQDGTTSLLIDFTQQFDSLASYRQQNRSPVRPVGLSPSRTESNLASYMSAQRSPMRGSPVKQQSSLLNLLDFELPPPPTPRSAPAFSAREVESLKSGFQSQISGIKAKLSGKEAEVESLRKALEDAERRVGEVEEKERLERIRREAAEQEKESWEQRGVEVEKLLASVKEEVVKSEVERDSLLRRTDEAERRAEELEGRNLDLTTRLAAVSQGDSSSSDADKDDVQRLVQAQLDAKIESVSRELHAVYKKKHETKVATLKKSYEARSEKKCAELQARVDELSHQNEELKMGRDETFSGELGVARGGASKQELDEKRLECERYRAEVEEQIARMAGLQQEIVSIKEDHSRLLGELETERVEKGELVAAVDEMLALQSSDSVPQAVVEDFRKSLSRPSGLRAPAPGMTAESKVARPSGLAKMGLGKSKMMSNIERMGDSEGAARIP
ncbi:hypothetical protein ANO11243_095410 [Dothideomycetidae sp. 11243]|nr:hypothetical protein ANO11243_095410 [fungal sp. No.11243]